MLKIMNKILLMSYVYFMQELSTILFKKKSVTINFRTGDKKKERKREKEERGGEKEGDT